MPTSDTNDPLKVSTDGTAGPYVIVTPEQLGPVVLAFREEGLDFHVVEDAVLLRGAPALAIIDLDQGADVEQIQGILDGVATALPLKERRGRRFPSHQALVVQGSTKTIQHLMQRLDVESVGHWVREHDVESRFRKTLPSQTVGYCFSKRVLSIERQIAVLLRAGGHGKPGGLLVLEIVPVEPGAALGPKDYDEVITDVQKTLIEPVARGLRLRTFTHSMPAGPGLEDSLSPDALARLQSFTMTANKAIPHALDMERWSSFIRQAHLDDALIEPEMLAAWLAEEGFQAEQRDLLIHEYQSGRQLLSAYDEERQ
jgi:hypothetical protein